MILIKQTSEQTRIEIMSDGKLHWLVFLDEDGTWITHQLISEKKAKLLKSRGIELHVDTGMSNPDE